MIKNEKVRMDVLIKICRTLGVNLEDIMELVPNTADERK
jgi:DNA-binding Xre family transcriptional regulator